MWLVAQPVYPEYMGWLAALQQDQPCSLLWWDNGIQLGGVNVKIKGGKTGQQMIQQFRAVFCSSYEKISTCSTRSVDKVKKAGMHPACIFILFSQK